MINVNGTLYGTTDTAARTCVVQCGTVFSITTNGTEKVLYSFGGGSDGAFPGGLDQRERHAVRHDRRRRRDGYGTVFSITTPGTEKVLLQLRVAAPTELIRTAGLIDVNGMLYGTTFPAARTATEPSLASRRPAQENVLLQLRRRLRWSEPSGGLINVNGTLYGTTTSGGGGGCRRDGGCGTIFALTP